MAQYALHPSPQTFNSRRFLLGPPLLMVAAFCFGLVLVHSPSQPLGQSIDSGRPAAKADNTSSNLSSKLLPISPSIPSALSTAPTEATTNTSASPTAAATNPQVSNTFTAKLQTITSPTDQTTNSLSKPNVLKTTTNGLTNTLNNFVK